MAAKLIVVVVVIAFDSGLFDGAVHALDLTVRPGVRDLCQAMVDPVFMANTIKDVPTSRFVYFTVGELDAVIGENRVDFVGQHFDQISQELGCNHLSSTFVQFHISELRSPVDCNKQSQLALFGAHFGDVDMEIANRVAFELLFGWLVTLHLGQAADAVPLQATVQGGPRKVRDGRLQRIKAIIQGKQGVAAEGDYDRFLLNAEDCGSGLFWAGFPVLN